MTDSCAFRIRLIAANAIGLLRPKFLETILLIDDARLVCAVDDQWCRIECSRELALVLANELRQQVRSGVIPLDTGAACSEAAAIIFTAIRRSDDTRRQNGQSPGGKTTA